MTKVCRTCGFADCPGANGGNCPRWPYVPTEWTWRTDEDADLSYPTRADEDPRDAEYIGGYRPGLED